MRDGHYTTPTRLTSTTGSVPHVQQSHALTRGRRCRRRCGRSQAGRHSRRWSPRGTWRSQQHTAGGWGEGRAVSAAVVPGWGRLPMGGHWAGGVLACGLAGLRAARQGGRRARPPARPPGCTGRQSRGCSRSRTRRTWWSRSERPCGSWAGGSPQRTRRWQYRGRSPRGCGGQAVGQGQRSGTARQGARGGGGTCGACSAGRLPCLSLPLAAGAQLVAAVIIAVHGSAPTLKKACGVSRAQGGNNRRAAGGRAARPAHFSQVPARVR